MWQACLKKTEVELELLTNIDILLMAEKDIRSGICHAIQRYANNKYMNNYKKNVERSSTECNSTQLSYLIYLDANNLYGQTMSQTLPVNGFKLVNKYLNLMSAL